MLVRIVARIVVLSLCISVSIAATVEAFAATPASKPDFRLPIDCTLGKDCWIINYPDATAGRRISGTNNGKDYTCGPRTYKKHKGTDFAVADERTMRQGVAVLAPKSGVVTEVRDGFSDGLYLQSGGKAMLRYACGNSVRIKHARHWSSLLCHLRKGSVKVKVGDRVNVGDPVGLVGLSGKTEFPHVHFSVRHKGKLLDPFTSSTLGMGCGEQADSLWHPAVTPKYRETVIYAAGFTDRALKAEQVKDDVQQYKHKPTLRTSIFAWMTVFGVKPDMTLRLEARAPDGRVFLRKTKKTDTPKAWLYFGVGKRKPATKTWPPGVYALTASVERDGKVLSRRQTRIDLQ